MNAYDLLSLTGSFFATLLVLIKARSLIVLFALAVMLYWWFGPLAIIGLLAAGLVRMWVK